MWVVVWVNENRAHEYIVMGPYETKEKAKEIKKKIKQKDIYEDDPIKVLELWSLQEFLSL